MRVRDCIISVAEINPYYGREIPGHVQLGLDANSVYDLYRHPDELAAAVDSFNGLPLMIRHVAQTADDPRKHDQAGSVFNARYDADAGQLRADLLVSDAKAIELIASGQLADLSSSYRYTPDMTPGDWSGKKYHGSMRGIQGNHVALVEDGRATGAHVADSALSSPTGVTTVENDTPDMAQMFALLADKLDKIDERIAKLEGATPKDTAPLDPVVKADDEASDPDKDKKAEDSDMDDKKEHAMDAKTVQALIDAAVRDERARAKSLDEAKRACRGELGDMIAMDSAADIYRAALKERGVDVASIPAGTEKAAYQAIQAVTARVPSGYAHDSKSDRGDVKRVSFDTSRIRNRG